MSRQDGYKQTGKITPIENERIKEMHSKLKGKRFQARDLHGMFSVTPTLIQRYLWIGRDLGLFAYDRPSTGNKPAIYKAMDVDAKTILDKITRNVQWRKTVEMRHVETPCELANIMGLKPIEHDCKPRMVFNNYAGGRVERSRQRVYAGGGWMDGL